MDRHYLPKKENKAYSPKGVRSLIEQAEKENDGNLEAVFINKNKYKNLIEMYHANFLALALYKRFGDEYKFQITEGNDPPDVYLVQSNGNGAIPLEIMELFKYKGKFKDYSELVSHIYKTKGSIKFNRCHLLLANRINSNNFNVTKFIEEMNKFEWFFERIWLSLYTKAIDQWTFFEIFPYGKNNDSEYMSFSLNEDQKFWY